MIRQLAEIAFIYNTPRCLKKKIRILKDEKGIALPFFVVFLVITLLSTTLTIDMGSMLIARHKMQSIADSASLAGASMTKVNGIYDSSGIPIGFTAVVDLPAAQQEAEEVIQENLNEINLAGVGITIISKSITSPTSGQIYVEIQYKVKTMLLGGIDQVTPIRDLTMKAKSKAEIKL